MIEPVIKRKQGEFLGRSVFIIVGGKIARGKSDDKRRQTQGIASLSSLRAFLCTD